MMDAFCGKCGYFEPMHDGSHGNCRRHAPVVYVECGNVGDNMAVTATAWPNVLSDDWCGDFKEEADEW